LKNILGIRDLESMPAQAARAFQLASDPRARSSDFVEVIESDEALSSRVIRIANSVYFFRGHTATDIEKAVANIGLDELRCLLSATMLRSMLQADHKVRKQIWANSVSVAIGSRILASYTHTVSDSEAFLCGLVHDIGKLIMIRRNGALYEKAVGLAASGERTFTEAEEEAFETNHIEVGRWVAEQWNFPDITKQAIVGHHQPWPTEPHKMGNHTEIGPLVRAADTMAHALGIGHPTGLKGFQQARKGDLEQVWKLFGIEANLGENMLQSFHRQFEQEASLYDSEA
jgi:HD-like signal output (HDOD) protein